MQLAYGGKRLTANSALISLREDFTRNNADQILEIKRMIHVQGDLVSTSSTATAAQADLKAQLDSLRAALAVQQQDLIFFQDSGAEALALKNANSISGVKIGECSYVENREDGAEFATILTYSFSAESIEPAPGSASLLIEYSETAKFGGGEPTIVCALGINGVNQEQEIYPQGKFFCSIAGRAKGYKRYPTMPKKPGREWREEFEMGSPERHGRGYTAFPISWSFSRESIEPLTFVPRTWIGA